MGTNNISGVMTAIVFDFETGGLDCTKCGAVQISMHAVRLDTFEVTESINYYIQPYNKKQWAGLPKKKVLVPKDALGEEELMEYGEKAEKVHGISISTMKNLGVPLEDVCKNIINFVERNTFGVIKSKLPFFIGQNPMFDEGFLQQIFAYTGLWKDFCKVVRTVRDFWGNEHLGMVDTTLLAQLAFGDDKSMPSFKLELIAEKLGIDLDDAHDADADVTATREIAKVFTARMRNANGETGAVGSIGKERRTKLRDHFKI